MDAKSPNGHPITCECLSCDQYGAPWQRTRSKSVTQQSTLADVRARLEGITSAYRNQGIGWFGGGSVGVQEVSVLLSFIDQAEKVLEPFADAANDVDDDVEPDLRCGGDMAIGDASYEVVTVDHCRAASNLLNQLKGE